MDEFDEAFVRLFRHAYRVGYRMLGDREAARDVAQEALARAYVRWQRIAPYADAWVVKVAGNIAVDVLRRAKRASLVNPVGVDDPHHAERLDLQRALLTLSRRQREVVVLRYLADLSERDTAQALGCSVGAVKTHGSRGLTALRAALLEAEA